MPVLTPLTSTSELLAIGADSASFLMVLDGDHFFELSASVGCYVRQGDGVQTASAASGNVYVPANTRATLHGARGDTVAVIQATGAGTATLTKMDAR